MINKDFEVAWSTINVLESTYHCLCIDWIIFMKHMTEFEQQKHEQNQQQQQLQQFNNNYCKEYLYIDLFNNVKKFKKQQLLGDGNCLYTSLVLQLNQKISFKWDQQKLRNVPFFNVRNWQSTNNLSYF